MQKNDLLLIPWKLSHIEKVYIICKRKLWTYWLRVVVWLNGISLFCIDQIEYLILPTGFVHNQKIFVLTILISEDFFIDLKITHTNRNQISVDSQPISARDDNNNDFNHWDFHQLLFDRSKTRTFNKINQNEDRTLLDNSYCGHWHCIHRSKKCKNQSTKSNVESTPISSQLKIVSILW